MIPTSEKAFESFLETNNENTFFMRPTSTVEVEDVISSFYLNKALGPNSLPMKILKDLKKELSKPLTIVINLTFSLGIFSNCNTKVIPAFEKGDSKSVTITDQFPFCPISGN